MRPPILRLLCQVLVNRDLFAVLAQTLKLNCSVLKGEKCVITAAANIGAGMNFGSALSDKDVAGEYELTVSSLGTKAL